MPVGVFVPRTTADVKTALDICRVLNVPIVARGGGTSQCGQTVGAGLVIDHSKHLRSILNVDADKRTAEVEPGIVLDHMNAALKKHSLRYPVDVSTSAQATLGGMAGNNSCGSRSIAYGNMVHNVLGASVWRSDGALLELGRYEQASGDARALGDYVKALSDQLRPELEAHWPKVLRRVAGYNLDIFNNQNEKPYTTDGSVNLAHLLVGSEGTLGLTKSLTLKLSELPRTKVLGLSSKRTLPQWQTQTFFNSVIKTATRDEVLAASKPAVLFVDTFNGYFESKNALAALKVLQAAGYTVHVASKSAPDGKALCCGRTYLASGMVDHAKAKATELVNALLPFAAKGIAIVGLEPSCLLTLRDETLVMGLGDAAQTVSRHALLFEEFLAREAAAGQLDALKQKLKPTTQPILLHGHCHQKAFGAVSPIMDVLRLIPGAQLELIESSCCGMAGSFGYEAAHYDVSMQMAELSLLPAVRKRPDAIVVADGTSCRHQIRDGAAREAVHVAALLARQLA